MLSLSKYVGGKINADLRFTQDDILAIPKRLVVLL